MRSSLMGECCLYVLVSVMCLYICRLVCLYIFSYVFVCEIGGKAEERLKVF
ncbi:hypothetical protein IHE45_15G060100 [Dioscorea alata]|uniref:Uncharacterized protein n=1 Tax=Dioscorea alata TaxID=55571 RepID=A0ACB7ULQ5_DIOAL|nr:hypothetical protein IHE45_15G060100 [Dioscorea alata]